MKFKTKRALIDAMVSEHKTFVALAGSIAKARYNEEGVWGDGWTIKDLFAHLTEWAEMFLRWHQEGIRGAKPALPAPGFKWNQTPELNRAIRRKHRRKSLKKVLGDFDKAHKRMLSLARRLPEEALLTPGHFSWTGKLPLMTFLAANSSSHYRAGTKMLKRWLKGTRRMGAAPGGIDPSHG